MGGVPYKPHSDARSSCRVSRKHYRKVFVCLFVCGFVCFLVFYVFQLIGLISECFVCVLSSHGAVVSTPPVVAYPQCTF